jgi:hypothetical protein
MSEVMYRISADGGSEHRAESMLLEMMIIWSRLGRRRAVKEFCRFGVSYRRLSMCGRDLEYETFHPYSSKQFQNCNY